MTDAAATSTTPHAGELLRQAREAQGISPAKLAGQIKVPESKLLKLELGQYEDLGDPNLTRALALTVCRALRIDHKMILERLPQARLTVLSDDPRSLNTLSSGYGRPAGLFDRRYRFNLSAVWGSKWIAPAVFLSMALAIYFVPQPFEWSGSQKAKEVPGAPPVSVLSTDAAPPDLAASIPASSVTHPPAASEIDTPLAPTAQPSEADPPTASASAVAAARVVAPAADQSGSLTLALSDQSWIEVLDASGNKLFSRIARAGETVSLQGQPPLRLHIGNASAVQVSFNGHGVALTEISRNNTARLELK